MNCQQKLINIVILLRYKLKTNFDINLTCGYFENSKSFI